MKDLFWATYFNLLSYENSQRNCQFKMLHTFYLNMYSMYSYLQKINLHTTAVRKGIVLSIRRPYSEPCTHFQHERIF